MMPKYDYVQEFCDMDLSYEQYTHYCTIQRERKVSSMCKAISQLKNMSADDLLEFCGQSNKIPVDLKAILRKLGISAIPIDFSGAENDIRKKLNANVQVLGAIATKGDHAAIFYNRKNQSNSHRSRFTIAHELGHCCLNNVTLEDGKTHIDCRIEGIAQNEDEIAANVFAGELLIPEKALYSTIEKLLLPSVHILAEIFDVSDNVMLKRLEYLKVKKNIAGYNF